MSRRGKDPRAVEPRNLMGEGGGAAALQSPCCCHRGRDTWSAAPGPELVEWEGLDSVVRSLRQALREPPGRSCGGRPQC